MMSTTPDSPRSASASCPGMPRSGEKMKGYKRSTTVAPKEPNTIARLRAGTWRKSRTTTGQCAASSNRRACGRPSLSGMTTNG
ncbi:hypothetical protein BC567DRAFT_233412 [Phyllosticta citribraziliensis]